MHNRTINIGVVEEVAIALADLKDQMVFVGGAVLLAHIHPLLLEERAPILTEKMQRIFAL